MSGWLDPLHAALDDAPAPVPFFVRDDDAGWDDNALWVLLDRLAAAPVPVDVAVIPAEVTAALAGELNRRVEEFRGDPGGVAVHQHGWTHDNHEPTGRKCEFGPSRDAAEQMADLTSGRTVMLDVFGPDAGHVFVPPWNRCTQQTASLVHELGFRALSRDLSAGLAAVPGLAELPVTVDWFAKRRGGGSVDSTDRGSLLASAVREVSTDAQGSADAGHVPRAVGVMLHHAVTGSSDLAEVGALADLLSAHPRAAPSLMVDLLA